MKKPLTALALIVALGAFNTGVAQAEPTVTMGKTSFALGYAVYTGGTGTVASVPLTIKYTVSDPYGICNAYIYVSRDGGSWQFYDYLNPNNGSASYETVYADSGHSYRYMVEADSCGGGYFTSATTTSTFLGYLSENSGRYSGTWVSQTNSNFVGSSARKSSSNGASVTYTVAAKNYAYLSPENVGLGQAKEYVAGSFFTTVDLSNSYLSNTLVISRKSYTTKASRTYKIQEASGTGPIMTDGLAYMY